jgi:transcriptional regulator with XRE-family HTH domain
MEIQPDAGYDMSMTKEQPTKELLKWLESNPLRLWRLAQKPFPWNKEQLARMVGVSGPTIGHWERGRQLPSDDREERLEEIVGETICWQLWQWLQERPCAK